MTVEERQPLLGDLNDTLDQEQSTYLYRLRNRKYSRLEKVVIPLATVLFVSLGVLAGVYIKHIHNEKPQVLPNPPSDDSSAPLCLTPECVLTAAQVLKDIDTTLDPCEDFFEYTCSKWAKTNEYPEGASSTSAFIALYEENKKSIRNILSGTLDEFYDGHNSSVNHEDKATDKQVFQKVKNLYESCINENLIDSRGPEPIFPLLKEISKLFPTSNDETLKPKKLTEALAFLTKKGAGSPFNFLIEADPKNPNVNAVHLYQSGLSLPSREYYDSQEYVQLLHKAIVDTLDVVLSKHKAYDTELDVETTARLIVDFEKKIAVNSEFYEYFMDPERTYNLISTSELTKISPTIDWELYIDLLTPTGTPLAKNIVVTSPRYVSNIDKLFEAESSGTLQAYFTWQVIFTYANALGEKVRAPLRSLNSKLSGLDPKAVKPRWNTCIEEINHSLGFLAGRYYVINNFSASTKKRADDFVDSIKDAFVQRLPEYTWIDDATRAKAIEKIGTLTRKIGYPNKSPNVLSPDSLLDYYKGLNLGANDYFGNFEKSREFNVAKLWGVVGRTPDKAKWNMAPQEVNAYYSPTANEINFPAGILQNPLFGDNYPDYMNYGGIGVVVGHELTHGYDDMGRHFDGTGRLVEWWSNATAAKFDEKAQCFVKQYNNFTLIGEDGEPISVNGRLTLAENLADNGGLSESHFAWKQRYDSDRESKVYNNVRLPGLENFSLEQLFFINFGRIWCNKMTLAEYKKQVLTDEHSPRRWRVNGAIQNSRAFAKAFKCPTGSRMNPVEKCEIW